MKIALIAHDKKKPEIIELAKEYKDILGILFYNICLNGVCYKPFLGAS